MSYEIHVTCYARDAVVMKEMAAHAVFPWKFSQIAGDPILGDDTYAYLTAHRSTESSARAALADCVADLKRRKITIVREKIEEIIHDVRHIPKAQL